MLPMEESKLLWWLKTLGYMLWMCWTALHVIRNEICVQELPCFNLLLSPDTLFPLVCITHTKTLRLDPEADRLKLKNWRWLVELQLEVGKKTSGYLNYNIQQFGLCNCRSVNLIYSNLEGRAFLRIFSKSIRVHPVKSQSTTMHAI